MDRSSTLAVVARSLLYVAGFWLLCGLLAGELSSKVIAGIAIVFIAALAIEPRNSMWNTVILSETFSSTCAVVSIAAWIYAAARLTRRSIILAW